MSCTRFAMRALPALMLVAAVAACSRAPEPEVETTPKGRIAYVIVTEPPPPEQWPPVDEDDSPVRLAGGQRPEYVVGFGNSYSEDPSDRPNCDLSEDVTEDESNAQSPHPNTKATAIGLGGVGLGGGSGGGGRGGQGGFAYRRARGGGGRPHEDRSRAALEWLKDHQHPDGYWSAASFAANTTRTAATRSGKDDAGWEDQDVYVTGLALLAFAGSGYDHKEGDYRQTCRAAILHLRKLQDIDGCIGDKSDAGYFIAHCAATAALAEIYGLSGDQVIKPVVDKAVEYLVKARNKEFGWGDEPGDGVSNLLNTAWAVLARKSGVAAGVQCDHQACFAGAREFLKFTLLDGGKNTKYVVYSHLHQRMPRPRKHADATSMLEEALWLWCAQAVGGVDANAESTFASKMAAQPNQPLWADDMDFEYWHWATLALYQRGGNAWKTWEYHLALTLNDNQRGYTTAEQGRTRADLQEHGSWDPADVWSDKGGRVASTALNGLTMQVWSRYLRTASSPDRDKDDTTDPPESRPVLDPVGLAARKHGREIGDFPLRHTDVRAKVSGSLAGTTVTQTFTNPYTEVIEAVYTFPLPGDAAINHFVMELQGRRIIGIIKPRHEAAAAYREAKARGHTASLMVQHRPNVFSQNVANIGVGEELKVTITYFQTLSYDKGRYEYVFPLTLGERYQSGAPQPQPEPEPEPPMLEPEPEPEPARNGWTPHRGANDKDGLDDPDEFTVRNLPQGMRSGMDVSLVVEIESALPVDPSTLRSVAHEVGVSMTSQGSTLVSLAGAAAVPNRDFVLRWSVAGSRPAVGLLTHTDDSGGYLDLQFQPQLEPADADITPREITFLLDVSGSMSGGPSMMSREVIDRVLKHLRPDDRFNIIKFASGDEQLFETPQAGSAVNLAAARTFLDKAKAGGGTEMLNALTKALNARRDPRYLPVFAFLTDGYITGEWDIFDAIKTQGGAARFFGFGIGSSVNRHLIDGIAEHGKGRAIYCLPRDGEYSNTAVAEFFGAIDTPVLCDIEIDWNGLAVTDVVPGRIHDLFAAQPLQLQARYSGSGMHTVYVRGRVGSRHVEHALTLDLDQPAYNPAIAAIWARQRVKQLETEMLTTGELPGSVREITNLCLQHNLVSRYTSFLAVDESRVVGDGRPLTVLQPSEMPENLLLAGSDKPGSTRSFDVEGWGMTVGETADGRVLVLTVRDGGAAARAGMKPGQVLRRINWAEVTDLDRLDELLSQAKAAIEVETSLTDEGRVVEAKFKLPEIKK